MVLAPTFAPENYASEVERFKAARRWARINWGTIHRFELGFDPTFPRDYMQLVESTILRGPIDTGFVSTALTPEERKHDLVLKRMRRDANRVREALRDKCPGLIGEW